MNNDKSENFKKIIANFEKPDEITTTHSLTDEEIDTIYNSLNPGNINEFFTKIANSNKYENYDFETMEDEKRIGFIKQMKQMIGDE